MNLINCEVSFSVRAIQWDGTDEAMSGIRSLIRPEWLFFCEHDGSGALWPPNAAPVIRVNVSDWVYLFEGAEIRIATDTQVKGWRFR